MKDAPQAIPVSRGENNDPIGALGEIRFENVSFSYEENHEGEIGLQGIHFVINPGQTAAFVGPSGTGKRYVSQDRVSLHHGCSFSSVPEGPGRTSWLKRYSNLNHHLWLDVQHDNASSITSVRC